MSLQECFVLVVLKSLIKYYELFKKKKNEGTHNLNIATIFSFAPNEKDDTVTGWVGFDDDDDRWKVPTDSRDKT